MPELKTAFNAGCLNCGLQKICFPTGLVRSDISRLDAIVERKAPFRKGDHIFRTGQAFSCLFAVRAGVIKIYNLSDTGEEQILGFYLAGDVIGLDAITHNCHMYNAVALDTTSVCAIPFERLETLSIQIPALNRQMYCLMSKGVNEGRLHSEILSKRNADQRLAHFIWSIAQRFMSRGYAFSEFRLGILHRDVALFLGLTPETVSRILAKFAQDDLVYWKRKEIKIVNVDRLRQLAGECTHDGLTDLKVKSG